MKLKNLTQKEIADIIGVSQATVSVALRNPNSSDVSADVRKRILETSKRLSYVGDARGRKQRICFAMPAGQGIVNYFRLRVLSVIESLAASAGYSVIIKHTTEDLSAGDVLFNLGCDGMIDHGSLGKECLMEIKKFIPVVGIGSYSMGKPETDFVCTDEVSGVAEMVETLVSLGHRRIAFVGPIRTVAALPEGQQGKASGRSCARLAGFLGKCYEMGLPVDKDLVFTQERMEELGAREGHCYEDALKMMLALPVPPTALVAYNDIIARSVISDLKRMGYSVPRDVSVAGFDDMFAGNLSSPKLTTVAPDIEMLGRIALETLLGKINHSSETANLKIMAGTTIVTGESVGMVPQKP